jgi:hypothetical protein
MRALRDFVPDECGFGFGVKTQHGTGVQRSKGVIGMLPCGHHDNVFQTEAVQGFKGGDFVFGGGGHA